MAGPTQRRVYLPADYGDADLELAEAILIRLDLGSLWVAWLVGKGPAPPPRLRE